MNDFLDNLGKVVNETAKKAIKASGNVLELTKTSLNIKFDEAKRDSFFKEIGKIIYGTYKESPESAADEILEFCKCIDEIEESINTQKAKAASIKNKKFCVDCGTILAKPVNYCYSCGAKQPEIIEEEEESCDCCCSSDDDCGDEAECEDSAECCESDDCCDGGSGESEACCSDESCDCADTESSTDAKEETEE